MRDTSHDTARGFRLHDRELRLHASLFLMCLLPCMTQAEETAPLAHLLHTHQREAEILLVSYLRGFLSGLNGTSPQLNTSNANTTHASRLLSPHEQRVLELLADGHTRPQIAQTLVISINTVKTQLNHIYRKLQVNCREDAIEAARRLGLI